MGIELGWNYALQLSNSWAILNRHASCNDRQKSQKESSQISSLLVPSRRQRFLGRDFHRGIQALLSVLGLDRSRCCNLLQCDWQKRRRHAVDKRIREVGPRLLFDGEPKACLKELLGSIGAGALSCSHQVKELTFFPAAKSLPFFVSRASFMFWTIKMMNKILYDNLTIP